MPISLKRLAEAQAENKGKIIAVPATVTEDARVWEVPNMTVCALKFTETARARIVGAGGSCITFDQLAQQDPYSENVVVVKGDPLKRFSQRFMGLAPGHRFSTTWERTNRPANRVLEDRRTTAGKRLARAQRK